MRDDDVTDAERRLRAVLRPADERVRHVMAGALSSDRQIHARRPVRLLAAGIVGLMIAIATLWRTSAPSPPALEISGTGSVVVVTSQDGRRWVINAQSGSTPRGEYVIAFPR